MTKIIAEISTNHLGNPDLIETYFEASLTAGIDYLKFQVYDLDLINKNKTTLEDLNYYTKCKINPKKIMILSEKHAQKVLFTAFSMTSVDEIYDAISMVEGEKIIKIASPDMLSYSLIDKCLNRFDRVLISTGMHSTTEINDLISYLITKKSKSKVTLLHCVSQYPVAFKNINMARTGYLKYVGIDWGYSDHSLELAPAIMACAMGASFVEKHVTLSKYLPSRDSKISCSFDKMKTLCNINKQFIDIRGGMNPKKLTKEDALMREKYVRRWGDNR